MSSCPVYCIYADDADEMVMKLDRLKNSIA
jgi:hypothetical protein